MIYIYCTINHPNRVKNNKSVLFQSYDYLILLILLVLKQIYFAKTSKKQVPLIAFFLYLRCLLYPSVFEFLFLHRLPHSNHCFLYYHCSTLYISLHCMPYENNIHKILLLLLSLWSEGFLKKEIKIKKRWIFYVKYKSR